VLLLPSWPVQLLPQHQAPPSFSAQRRFQPTLIALTPLASPGAALSTWWPFPKLSPHQTPPLFTAQVSLFPALMAVTSLVSPDTARGPAEMQEVVSSTHTLPGSPRSSLV